MAKTRLPYSPEFRRQMVELVRAGRDPDDLAQQFEPTSQSIRNWMARADKKKGREADAPQGQSHRYMFSYFGQIVRPYNNQKQKTLSESVRELLYLLQSFLIMKGMEAKRRKLSAERLRFSQSFARRWQRLSQAMVRSTIHRFGNT